MKKTTGRYAGFMPMQKYTKYCCLCIFQILNVKLAIHGINIHWYTCREQPGIFLYFVSLIVIQSVILDTV